VKQQQPAPEASSKAGYTSSSVSGSVSVSNLVSNSVVTGEDNDDREDEKEVVVMGGSELGGHSTHTCTNYSLLEGSHDEEKGHREFQAAREEFLKSLNLNSHTHEQNPPDITQKQNQHNISHPDPETETKTNTSYATATHKPFKLNSARSSCYCCFQIFEGHGFLDEANHRFCSEKCLLQEGETESKAKKMREEEAMALHANVDDVARHTTQNKNDDKQHMYMYMDQQENKKQHRQSSSRKSSPVVCEFVGQNSDSLDSNEVEDGVNCEKGKGKSSCLGEHRRRLDACSDDDGTSSSSSSPSSAPLVEMPEDDSDDESEHD